MMPAEPLSYLVSMVADIDNGETVEVSAVVPGVGVVFEHAFGGRRALVVWPWHRVRHVRVLLGSEVLYSDLAWYAGPS